MALQAGNAFQHSTHDAYHGFPHSTHDAQMFTCNVVHAFSMNPQCAVFSLTVYSFEFPVLRLVFVSVTDVGDAIYFFQAVKSSLHL